MKILYFLAHPGVVGGADKVLLKEAKIMQMRGHNVHVLLPLADEYANTDVKNLCDTLFLSYEECCYKCAVCIEDIDILATDVDYVDITKRVESFAPDFIHYNQLNLTAEVVSNQFRIPHLMSIFPVSEESFNIEWCNVFPKYHCADSILYSDKWKTGLHIESRCIRVPYEKSVEVDVKQTVDDGYIRIINVGNVDRYKRQLDLIKCVEKCIANGMKIMLTFLGYCNSSYGVECANYVEEHSLRGMIHFKGYVDNVEEYMSTSDVLIHTSSTESYPGVLVEAMANHVPIISTPAGGITELVVDGENGFLTGGFGEEYISEAFERFLVAREDGSLNRIIENAYITYCNNHSFSAVGERLEEYYNQIMCNYDFRGTFCISELKDLVKDIRYCFPNSDYSEYTLNHLWYLYHIRRIAREQSYTSAYIWGAGQYGFKIREWVEVLEICLKGYIDKNKKGSYLGVNIYSPSEIIIADDEVVFVAIGNADAMKDINQGLILTGKKRNFDMFNAVNNPCV